MNKKSIGSRLLEPEDEKDAPRAKPKAKGKKSIGAKLATFGKY